ncbi:MAG TPA: TMEM165/GDT1 family protein [Candidatus Binatia bacterium]|nr:TMEM165/GDT1 family protein [Candidatus Binatia bacterium]
MTAFLTIFLSVFVAELGDKTQLATALFAADGVRSKWLVFLASSGALVASAAVATLAGSAARELLAGPTLKLIAGAGFILIGAFIVWSALRPA